MKCFPGETEGEETKRTGQESKLNGNTIFCHPGDPITFLKNPAIVNSLAVKVKDFIDHNTSYTSSFFHPQIHGGRITPDPQMPPSRLFQMF